ncbi:MAG: hypothetical protein FWF28_04595 [Micrococcales bacterium]|nr:hypothetical protein [Micrococcales bacterium]
MTARLAISVPGSSIRFVPQAAESRQKYAYVDGKRSDTPATDSKGRALQGFAATVELAGDRFSAQVAAPTPLPSPAPLGTVFQGTGGAVLAISNQRDAFDLRVSLQLDGFEPAKA